MSTLVPEAEAPRELVRAELGTTTATPAEPGLEALSAPHLPAPPPSAPAAPSKRAFALRRPAWLRAPGWLTFDRSGLTHHLRLRQRFPVRHSDGAVTLELGYDVPLTRAPGSGAGRPFALAIFRPAALRGSSIEVSSDWAAVETQVPVRAGSRSLAVTASVGRYWDGRPRVGVSLGAPRVEALVGAGLLASGKRLAQEDREVPLLLAELPKPAPGLRRFLGASIALDGAVQYDRTKGQLSLGLTKADPVLRLEHIPA